MDMKQNQTFPHGTHSNLRPYFFYQNMVKYFNDFQNKQFFSFMTKMNPNNGNEKKSDVFPWDIFKTDTISFLAKKY